MYDVMILSGISGVGKTYLIQQAVQEFKWLCQVPSVTTRTPREGINESASRVFLSAEQFDVEQQKGDLIFVNWIFGHRYAYRYSDIKCAIQNKKTVVLDIKISEVSKVKKAFPKSVCIYIRVLNRRIEEEIETNRNNRLVRIQEALTEQNDIINLGRYRNEIDILFENNTDAESVQRFYKVLLDLRGQE